MFVQDNFDIKKWHELIASNPYIKKKVHTPMIEMSQLKSDDKKIVFDLGCGSGELIKNAAVKSPGSVYVGIDWGIEVLDFAKTNLNNAGFHTIGPIKVNKLKYSVKKLFKNYPNHKKCVLVEMNYLTNKSIDNYADVVFFLFPQAYRSEQLEYRTAEFPARVSEQLQRIPSAIDSALSKLIAIKMLKVGGKLIEGLYSPGTKEFLRIAHESVNAHPYMKSGKQKLFNGKTLGEIILKGRYSSLLEKHLDDLKGMIEEKIKTSKGGHALLNQLAINSKIISKFKSGDFTITNDYKIIMGGIIRGPLVIDPAKFGYSL